MFNNYSENYRPVWKGDFLGKRINRLQMVMQERQGWGAAWSWLTRHILVHVLGIWVEVSAFLGRQEGDSYRGGQGAVHLG